MAHFIHFKAQVTPHTHVFSVNANVKIGSSPGTEIVHISFTEG